MRETIRREAQAFSIYLVILIVLLFMVREQVGGLKHDINTVVRIQCLQGSGTSYLLRYNDHVKADMALQIQSEKLNEAMGDAAKAALNAGTAARLKGDLIPIVKPDCSKPLLP